jgi:hypothetical protein
MSGDGASEHQLKYEVGALVKAHCCLSGMVKPIARYEIEGLPKNSMQNKQSWTL